MNALLWLFAQCFHSDFRKIIGLSMVPVNGIAVSAPELRDGVMGMSHSAVREQFLTRLLRNAQENSDSPNNDIGVDHGQGPLCLSWRGSADPADVGDLVGQISPDSTFFAAVPRARPLHQMFSFEAPEPDFPLFGHFLAASHQFHSTQSQCPVATDTKTLANPTCVCFWIYTNLTSSSPVPHPNISTQNRPNGLRSPVDPVGNLPPEPSLK